MKFIKSQLTQTQKDCSRRFDDLAGFDTETTGTDPETAMLCSYSFMCDDMSSFTSLVNPGIDIPLEATAVHGITTEEAVKKGLSHREAIENIESLFLAWYPRPVCIYNAPYDLGIVTRFTSVLGYILDPLVLDRTLDKYRSGRRTLSAVAAAYDIAITGAHTAEGDVLTTMKLTEAIFNRYPFLWEMNMDDLQEYQGLAYYEWASNFEKYRKRTDPSFSMNKKWPV